MAPEGTVTSARLGMNSALFANWCKLGWPGISSYGAALSKSSREDRRT